MNRPPDFMMSTETETVGEVLDRGGVVQWWGFAPGTERTILFWQMGRDGRVFSANHRALPALIAAAEATIEDGPYLSEKALELADVVVYDE